MYCLIPFFTITAFLYIVHGKLQLRSIPEQEVKIGQTIQVFAKGPFAKINQIQLKNEFSQTSLTFSIDSFTSSPTLFLPVLTHVVGDEFISSRLLRICVQFEKKTKCICLQIIPELAGSIYLDKSNYINEVSLSVFAHSITLDELRICMEEGQLIDQIAFKEIVSADKESKNAANFAIDKMPIGIYIVRAFLMGSEISEAVELYFSIQSNSNVTITASPDNCNALSFVSIFAQLQDIPDRERRPTILQHHQENVIFVEQMAFFCPSSKYFSIHQINVPISSVKSLIGTFRIEEAFSKSPIVEIYFLKNGIPLLGIGKIPLKKINARKVRVKVFPSRVPIGGKVTIYAENNTDLIQRVDCVQIDDTKLAINPINLDKPSILIATLSVGIELVHKKRIQVTLLSNDSPLSHNKVNFYIEQSNVALHLEPEHPSLNDEISIFAKSDFISHITSIEFSRLPPAPTLSYNLDIPIIIDDSWKLIYKTKLTAELMENATININVFNYNTRINQQTLTVSINSFKYIEIFAISKADKNLHVDKLKISSRINPLLCQIIILKSPITVKEEPTFITECALNSLLSSEKYLKIEAFLNDAILDEPTTFDHVRIPRLDNESSPIIHTNSDFYFPGDIVSFWLSKNSESDQIPHFLKDLEIYFENNKEKIIIFSTAYIKSETGFLCEWKIPDSVTDFINITFTFGIVYFDNPNVCNLMESFLTVPILPNESFEESSSEFTSISKLNLTLNHANSVNDANSNSIKSSNSYIKDDISSNETISVQDEKSVLSTGDDNLASVKNNETNHTLPIAVTKKFHMRKINQLNESSGTNVTVNKVDKSTETENTLFIPQQIPFVKVLRRKGNRVIDFTKVYGSDVFRFNQMQKSSPRRSSKETTESGIANTPTDYSSINCCTPERETLQNDSSEVLTKFKKFNASKNTVFIDNKGQSYKNLHSMDVYSAQEQSSTFQRKFQIDASDNNIIPECDETDDEEQSLNSIDNPNATLYTHTKLPYSLKSAIDSIPYSIERIRFDAKQSSSPSPNIHSSISSPLSIEIVSDNEISQIKDKVPIMKKRKEFSTDEEDTDDSNLKENSSETPLSSETDEVQKGSSPPENTSPDIGNESSENSGSKNTESDESENIEEDTSKDPSDVDNCKQIESGENEENEEMKTPVTNNDELPEDDNFVGMQITNSAPRLLQTSIFYLLFLYILLL